jgi:hypothetical protein
MFAISKAFAIADSIVSIQQGIAKAASLPFPANLGAMATVAASTASIVGNIQAVRMSFAGGGFTGNGPRSGGLDGQGGFLAMMHPKETVIDHTKPGGGGRGGAQMNVVINNNAPGVEATAVQRDDQTLEVVIEKVDQGLASRMRQGKGHLNRAVKDTYQLTRR